MNVLTYPLSFQKNAILNFPKLILKLVWIVGFLAFISLMVFYIFQVHQLVKEGYLVRLHENQIKDLKEQNRLLEINFSQINSLGNIEQRIKDLNFVETEKINYIQVLGSQVATK